MRTWSRHERFHSPRSTASSEDCVVAGSRNLNTSVPCHLYNVTAGGQSPTHSYISTVCAVLLSLVSLREYGNYPFLIPTESIPLSAQVECHRIRFSDGRQNLLLLRTFILAIPSPVQPPLNFGTLHNRLVTRVISAASCCPCDISSCSDRH
ncbi:hypothetical protein SCLCIDRAFT_1093160 [Scleroderma citrinum Foug A]|uniref:Uncharacterized protein n=1 Tax=Scleroderma citrinum Foug A TaxID=1036808 RepID=A0A0C3DQP8_9AGAM|nr:hypothetical protein SCLCIDRAFT_1093160 [Scleroderma citrinum Foug A]